MSRKDAMVMETPTLMAQLLQEESWGGWCGYSVAQSAAASAMRRWRTFREHYEHDEAVNIALEWMSTHPHKEPGPEPFGYAVADVRRAALTPLLQKLIREQENMDEAFSAAEVHERTIDMDWLEPARDKGVKYTPAGVAALFRHVFIPETAARERDPFGEDAYKADWREASWIRGTSDPSRGGSELAAAADVRSVLWWDEEAGKVRNPYGIPFKEFRAAFMLYVLDWRPSRAALECRNGHTPVSREAFWCVSRVAWILNHGSLAGWRKEVPAWKEPLKELSTATQARRRACERACKEMLGVVGVRRKGR